MWADKHWAAPEVFRGYSVCPSTVSRVEHSTVSAAEPRACSSSLTVGRLLVQVIIIVRVATRLIQQQFPVGRGRGQLGDVVRLLTVGRLDHEVGRVVRERTVQPDGGQEWHQLVGGALVHAVALGQHVHVVEQLEHAGTRLVDGAYDGAALVCEPAQELQAVRTRDVIQSAAETHERKELVYIRSFSP